METNQKPKEKKEEAEFPGYPLYPASEDIYSQGLKEDNINPEDINKLKEPNDKTNEGDNYHQTTGEDLDIPGSELDDEEEAIGMEDEENNYYSLGGDNHTDLDETNTDLVEEDEKDQ